MLRDRIPSVLVVVLLLAAITALAIGVGSAESSGEDSHFEVEMTGTNAPVAEGETLTVNATVTNTGDTKDHQQVHLKGFDGEIIDSVAQPPVTLAPGEETNVTLTWETELGEAGDGKVSVQSNDESPRQSISVERGAHVTINETNLPIEPGERLNVSVDVSTPRTTLETKRVWLAIDGSIKDEQRSVLLYDETDQVELTWISSEEYEGERTLTVGTKGHEEDRQITIDTVASSTSSDGSAASVDTDTSESDSDSSTSTSDTETSTTSSEQGSSSADSEPSVSQSDSESPTEADEQGTSGIVPVVLVVGMIGVGSLVAYRLRP